jgi:hypothetical protein
MKLVNRVVANDLFNSLNSGVAHQVFLRCWPSFSLLFFGGRRSSNAVHEDLEKLFMRIMNDERQR